MFERQIQMIYKSLFSIDKDNVSSVEDSTEGSSSDSDVSSDASAEDGDTIKIDNIKDGVYVNEAYDGDELNNSSVVNMEAISHMWGHIYFVKSSSLLYNRSSDIIIIKL